MVSTLFSTKPKSVQMDNPTDMQNGSVCHPKKITDNSNNRCFSVIKLLFCLLLLIISAFQVANYIFLIIYAPRYEFTINTIIEYPESMTLPGVTVCNNNRLQKTKMCNANPKFCGKNPELDNTYNFVIGKSASEIVKYAQKPYEFVEQCYAVNNVKYDSMFLDCGNITRLFFEPIINCFTIFSKWDNYKNYEKPEIDFDAISISLDFQKEEYTEPYRTVGGILFIHDPNSIPDIQTYGDAIKPGYAHIVTIEKTSYERLPPPYATNCRFYDSDGPRSQKVCFSECLHDTFVEKCGCMPFYEPQISARNQGNCDFGNTTFGNCYENHVPFITKQCKIACPLSCFEEEYKTKVERFPMMRKPAMSQDNVTIDDKAQIDIRFEKKTVTYVNTPNIYVTWREVSMLSLWTVLSLLMLGQIVIASAHICRCSSDQVDHITNQRKSDENDITSVVGIDININGTVNN